MHNYTVVVVTPVIRPLRNQGHRSTITIHFKESKSPQIKPANSASSL